MMRKAVAVPLLVGHTFPGYPPVLFLQLQQ